MRINYQKELEGAARSMILIHDHHILIKMIVRMMVQKVKVKHAVIALYNKTKNTYVLSVSRGTPGLKIPAGFARLDPASPLIRFFNERRNFLISKNGVLLYEDIQRVLRNRRMLEKEQGLRELILGAKSQMETFDTVACIPSYFRDSLLGLLLLGEKRYGKFLPEEAGFFVALASDVAMAIRNAELFEEVRSEMEKKYHLFIHTTLALAAAIDAKDHYTHGHTQRVTNYSLSIGRRLLEKKHDYLKLSSKFAENLHIASLLHDIGKIGISELILNKKCRLNLREREEVNKHPLIGVTILQPIKELGGEPLLGVKYHHERYDGTGYPEGLKGKQIPLIAAIISVADSFDAMTTDRPYRRALSKEEAVKEIRDNTGTQFHPFVSRIFLKLLKEKKV